MRGPRHLYPVARGRSLVLHGHQVRALLSGGHQLLQGNADPAALQAVRRHHFDLAVQPQHQTQPVGGRGHPVGSGDLLVPQLGHPHLRGQQISERHGLLLVVGLGHSDMRPGRFQALLHRLQRPPGQHQPPIGHGRVQHHLLLAPRQLGFGGPHPSAGLPAPVQGLPAVEHGLLDLEGGLKVRGRGRTIERVDRKVGLGEVLLLQFEPEGIHRIIGAQRLLRHSE